MLVIVNLSKEISSYAVLKDSVKECHDNVK